MYSNPNNTTTYVENQSTEDEGKNDNSTFWVARRPPLGTKVNFYVGIQNSTQKTPQKIANKYEHYNIERIKQATKLIAVKAIILIYRQQISTVKRQSQLLLCSNTQNLTSGYYGQLTDHDDLKPRTQFPQNLSYKENFNKFRQSYLHLQQAIRNSYAYFRLPRF